MTISDVARRAGVSKGLVSLALNGRPGVAAGTRQRVLDAAAELGWAPSQQARGLSMRTTFSLGLVVRRDPAVLAADPFFPSFIAGVESVLSTDGWSLVLSVAPDEEAEHRAYEHLARSRVDGFFLTDLRVDDPRPALLAGLRAEAVLVGPAQPGTELPSVNVDDRHGVIAAVEHLVALGHRRIAYVTGDVAMVHGRNRLDAFRQAVTRAGLTTDLIRPGDFSASSGASATSELLADPDPPTAIVYASDPMAVAGLGVLQALEVRVPAEVSVIGFDGVELGGYLHPPLTTVRTDPFGWGVEAARVLRARLGRGTAGTPATDGQHDLAAAELLLRGSTAPVPPRLPRPGALP
ncbi:LacI family DNA-binding transcriptional regulator [Desertihabitans aurantiacus]|uniref:LacI family DNA-binding transcriptional regulator n=1 Tax=Desertihabitans aurantiacus TaxID=2282477 RepID=UPI001E3DD7DF|nr:LacI family DNA-binding transcriptional regulator [Desertihabitans aurantiacus]